MLYEVITLAQPAVFILPALPMQWLADRLRPGSGRRLARVRKSLPYMIAILLPASIGLRDLPDYFQERNNFV